MNKKNYILYTVLTIISVVTMWLFVITQPIKTNGIYLSSDVSLSGCGGGVVGASVESECPAAILSVPLCESVSTSSSYCSNRVGFPFVVYSSLSSSSDGYSETTLNYQYNEYALYLNIIAWALFGGVIVALIAISIKIIKNRNE